MSLLYTIEAFKIYKTKSYKIIQFFFLLYLLIEVSISLLIMPRILAVFAKLNLQTDLLNEHIVNEILNIPNIDLMLGLLILSFLILTFLYFAGIALFLYDARGLNFLDVPRSEFIILVAKKFFPFLLYQFVQQMLWGMSLSITIIPALLYRLVFFYTPVRLLLGEKLKDAYKNSFRLNFNHLNNIFLSLLIIILTERVAYYFLSIIFNNDIQLITIYSFLKVFLIFTQARLIYLYYTGFVRAIFLKDNKPVLIYRPDEFIKMERSISLENKLQPTWQKSKETEVSAEDNTTQVQEKTEHQTANQNDLPDQSEHPVPSKETEASKKIEVEKDKQPED